MNRNGSCSCGDVQFSVEGDPFNTVFCYCTECQIASGSDKFYGVWYKPDQFQITQGKTKEFIRFGDSGGKLTYKFCEKCGTKLCAESSYGMITVAGAILDNTVGIEPQMAIFTKSATSWAILPTEIPCFKEMPPRKSA